MGKKKNSYSFLVKEKEDLDATRVAKEVREDKPNSVGFILIMRSNNDAMVCLYSDFLKKFDGGESYPFVLGEPLSPDWGLDSLPMLNKKDKLIVHSERGCLIFRTKLCSKNDIGSVRKELNEAKEALNSVRITVKIL